MKTYRNMAAALADPQSNAARTMRLFDAAKAENERVIAAWMARGLTREQAYKRALFGS